MATKTLSRLDSLREDCEKFGLYIATYSPGDGQTRYRFFDVPGNNYFGPKDGIYTALGLSDAQTFAAGYAQAAYRYRCGCRA